MSKLSVLRDVRELIRFIYTIELPKEEDYNLKSQVRRAAVSVALNIREGNVFDTKNKLRFFKIALGSLTEVDECVRIIEDLGYVNPDFHSSVFQENYYWKCLNKLKKLINSLHSTQNVEGV